MRGTDPIPTDWKQRVETCISNCKFLFLPEDKKPEVRRSVMLRLLRGSNVQAGAEVLWSLAGDLSRARLQKVRGDFHAHIASALFVLAMALRSRPPRSSAKPIREIAEALERVRDSRRFFQGEPERKELDRAIRFYRWAYECARSTKPKGVGPRIALCCLRSDFSLIFREGVKKKSDKDEEVIPERIPRGRMKIIDDAVGFFMQAAFGSAWDGPTVRTRYSEWSRPSPLRRRKP